MISIAASPNSSAARSHQVPDQTLEARIAAEDGDVGAVERGHQVRRSIEHAARQVRGGCVRNGVVDVDEIEAVALDDLGDLRRHRQLVRLVLEHRIARYGDLMEGEPLVGRKSAAGRSAGDDVELVTAAREAVRQLDGDDAAPAEARMADDPDPHGVRSFSVGSKGSIAAWTRSRKLFP
jgi:hypothetical protein